ncbi:MAG: hypothetical protein HOQ44_22415, partial [Nocardia sp.]|nr:hypothetical protein [Nocardia sp.]
MGNSLDDVWRTVREMLGPIARDAGDAIAALPTRAANHATEFAARAEKADATALPDRTATFTVRPREDVPTARPTVYVPGRDLIREVDYSALQRTGGFRSSGPQPMFEEIQRLQGFDGPVTV